MAGKRMTRLAEAESLRRIENAARTTGQFQELNEWYDKLDCNRERKERYHEITQGEYRLIYAEIRRRNRRYEARRKARQDGTARGYKYGNGGIIPPPLISEYWREVTPATSSVPFTITPMKYGRCLMIGQSGGWLKA